MRKLIIVVCFICLHLRINAQEGTKVIVDSLYREDQFYVGVTYNLLGNAPKDLSQSGFSGGYHLGFIRDIPINKNRNLAIGLGVGLSANSYNQNLFIGKDTMGSLIYALLKDRDTYSKNKFTTYLVEFPFEFRWRTSTPTEYKFWRIYTGFKIGYLLSHSAKYKGDLGSLKYHKIDHFNNLQYGLTVSIGYNTWNIHCYYTLNSIFSKEAQLNSSTIDMNSVKIGLMFYIL